jgi:hypothetical protein
MDVHDEMSDTEVLGAARDFLSGRPLGGPPDVEAIMAGGRARRRRRLIPGVTGTLAVAAGAALAVTALAPARHQPAHQASRQPSVQLAAWTVTRQPNGDINVLIRELEDPAGLQSTLRADGVPASVTFLPKLNPACQSYPGGKPAREQISTPLLAEVFPQPYENLKLQLPAKKVQPGTPPSSSPPPSAAFIVIDPSALPGNAGVQLGAGQDGAILLPQLVYASPKCTGS